jgi:hybrid cluster-associated redox disulfide protein
MSLEAYYYIGSLESYINVRSYTNEKAFIMTITKDMTIEDVVTQYPESMMVFMKHGLHCVGCHVSAFESIEDGAIAHGINVDALVADLNKVVSSRKPKA